MKIIDKIALIYLKDGKILATLSKGKDKYYMPGGKREEGETNEQTLIRECKEELNVNIKKDTIKYYGTFEAQAHGKIEGTIVKNKNRGRYAIYSYFFFIQTQKITLWQIVDIM